MLSERGENAGRCHQKSALVCQNKSIHALPAIFKCPDCGKRFNLKENMEASVIDSSATDSEDSSYGTLRGDALCFLACDEDMTNGAPKTC